MKLEKMQISELVKPEDNVRIHTEKQIDEFIRSLEMFGQIRPAVVDENNIILIGNGMVEAMEKRGDIELNVYRIKGLSENEKKKLMLSDNKIFSLGIDNFEVQDKFFKELIGDYDIPGFDEDVLKAMVSSAEEVTEKLSDFGTLDNEEIQKIKNKRSKQEEQNTDDSIAENQDFNDEVYLNENESEQEESERFIICPNCGEKICL